MNHEYINMQGEQVIYRLQICTTNVQIWPLQVLSGDWTPPALRLMPRNVPAMIIAFLTAHKLGHL